MSTIPLDPSLQSIQDLTWPSQDATWPFNVMATFLYFARMISRFYIKKTPLDWSDLIITIAWILDLCRAAFYQESLSLTRELRYDDLVEALPNTLFWTLLANYWTFIAIPVPKLSLGLLTIELFKPPRWLKWTIILNCSLLIVMGIAGFIAGFTRCSPAAAAWDPPEYPQAQCFSVSIIIDYIIAFSVYATSFDIFFTVYPGIVIANLQMRTSQKLVALALMSFGVAACVFAVFKMVYAINFTTELTNPFLLLKELIYTGIWCGIENDFVLIAACLPSTLPFFRAIGDWANKQKNAIRWKWHRLSIVPKETEYPDKKNSHDLSNLST